MKKITFARVLTFIAIMLSAALAIAAVKSIPGKVTHEMCIADYIKSLPEDNNAIEAKDLRKLINLSNKTFVIIDMRNPEEFSKGHISGSYNIAYKTLFNEETEKYFENKEVLYVLVDSDGSMSFQLLPFFVEQGFNVKALRCGLNGWVKMISGEKDVPSGNFIMTPSGGVMPPPPPPAKGGGGGSTFEPGGCG